MKLEDRFLVIKVLGQGSFGRVLLVEDRFTHVRLAAKVLKGRVTKATRLRFVREVKQLLRYARNPHVLPVVEAFLDAERPFFTMPLASGNLGQWAGRMNQGQLVVAMNSVIRALAGVHADNGLHRDVKPINLLVMFDGKTVVGDFGVGNNPNCTRNFTQSPQGTIAYMAPELFLSPAPAYTAACDIYSAGATWFELITGRTPPRLNVPLDPRMVLPGADPWMASWIIRMTDPLPQKRPSAFEVARALHERLKPRRAQTVPAVAPAPPPAASAQADTGIGPLVAVGAAVGILALLLKG